MRAANPDAYVVYKPHPDVLAGLRREGDGERLRPAWDRAIAEALPLVRQLPQVLAPLLAPGALERATAHYQESCLAVR